MKRDFKNIISGLLATVAILGLGTLTVRAQAEEYVTRRAFEQEAQFLRAQIFTLRAQVLEQRVVRSGQKLDGLVNNATVNNTPNKREEACATAESELRGHRDEWAELQALWPAGPAPELLGLFSAQVRQLCQRSK